MRTWIDDYAVKGGKRWRVRWELPPGPEGQRRVRSKAGFARKGDAAEFVRTLHAEQSKGRVVDTGDATVAVFLRSWLDGCRSRFKPTTVAGLKVDIEVHILPRIGGVKVRDVTPGLLRELYADLATRGLAAGRCRTAGITCREHNCGPERHGGLSPKSVHRVHGCLRQALEQAVADELVVRNVAAVKGVAPRRARDAGIDPETQAWNAEQARSFLDMVRGDRLVAMWHVFLGCGLRRGEVIALRWEHVDLETRTMRIRETVTLAAGEVIAQSDGKTRASRRTLDLDPHLVAILRAHKVRQAAEKLAAGVAWVDGGFVFTYPNGERLLPTMVSNAATRWIRAAGLPEIGTHGLRHTCATLLLRSGTPLLAVSRRLGHENAAITLQIYAHAMPEDDRLASAAIAGVLYGPSEATG